MVFQQQQQTAQFPKSERSVWAFRMASRRQAIVKAHTDRTRTIYRTCQMKQ